MLDIRVIRGWTFGYNELKRGYDGGEGRGGTSLIISKNNHTIHFFLEIIFGNNCVVWGWMW